jgi:hypothetical protein
LLCFLINKKNNKQTAIKIIGENMLQFYSEIFFRQANQIKSTVVLNCFKYYPAHKLHINIKLKGGEL